MKQCASFTKAVVAAAIALCVKDGKFPWNTPVKDILPDFHTRSEVLHEHMTLVDCLSHRAGMQSSLYWHGSMNNVLISKENSMNFINDLKRVKPFRKELRLENLGSGTHVYFDDGENLAKTYEALDDASVAEVVPMLSRENCDTSMSESPLKQVSFLFSRKIAMNAVSLHETSYAIGWARVQTPGPMGAIGLNADLLHPKPTAEVARGHASHLMLYHQGMMPGNLAAVNLVPSTQ
ncbi:MAG: hypothetical protein Q9203_000387 [Teloschistes exilis]